MADDSDRSEQIAFTRRAVLAGGVAALAGGHAFGAEAKSLADIVASFDRERERRHVPSISVALVEAGRVSLVVRGHRNAARGERAGPATLYQAASISKTIAAMTAIALASSGKVSLDADVAIYLKRWKLPPVPAESPRPKRHRRRACGVNERRLHLLFSRGGKRAAGAVQFFGTACSRNRSRCRIPVMEAPRVMPN